VIGRIETQLKQKHTVTPLFTIRRRIVRTGRRSQR
jgi:hypothetical protein